MEYRVLGRTGVKVSSLCFGTMSFGEIADEKTAAAMVKRGSAVLVTYYQAFRRRFPQLADAPNVFHFPLCFAPQGRYLKLPYRNERIRRCLVTGHSTPKVYPLRHHIKGRIEAHSAKFQQFVVMRHPRFKKSGRLQPWEIPAALNEEYALALNNFYCSIATASAYEYVLAKYFEIPAAGALLLAQHTPDLDRLGFTPDVHYIPIDESDFAAKTSAALRGAYPGPVERIRIDGMKFVRANHGLKNRLELFGDIMRKTEIIT